MCLLFSQSAGFRQRATCSMNCDVTMGLHWKGPTCEGHVLSIISRSKIIYFLLHLSNGYVHWYILHDRSNTLSYFFEISQLFEQTSKNNNEDDTFNNNQYLWTLEIDLLHALDFASLSREKNIFFHGYDDFRLFCETMKRIYNWKFNWTRNSSIW